MSATIAHEVGQPLAAIVAFGTASLRWLSNSLRTSMRAKRGTSAASSMKAIAPVMSYRAFVVYLIMMWRRWRWLKSTTLFRKVLELVASED